jgi:hypothetical protein
MADLCLFSVEDFLSIYRENIDRSIAQRKSAAPPFPLSPGQRFTGSKQSRAISPDVITAAKIKSGRTVRTRSLYPHPEVAACNGSGSTDAAVNSSCIAPNDH